MVESIGEHVGGFKKGDVVLPVFHPYCEECKDCKSPKSNWCAKFCDDFFIKHEKIRNELKIQRLFRRNHPPFYLCLEFLRIYRRRYRQSRQNLSRDPRSNSGFAQLLRPHRLVRDCRSVGLILIRLILLEVKTYTEVKI